MWSIIPEYTFEKDGFQILDTDSYRTSESEGSGDTEEGSPSVDVDGELEEDEEMSNSDASEYQPSLATSPKVVLCSDDEVNDGFMVVPASKFLPVEQGLGAVEKNAGDVASLFEMLLHRPRQHATPVPCGTQPLPSMEHDKIEGTDDEDEDDQMSGQGSQCEVVLSSDDEDALHPIQAANEAFITVPASELKSVIQNLRAVERNTANTRSLLRMVFRARRPPHTVVPSRSKGRFFKA